MSGFFESSIGPEMYAQELRHELGLSTYPVNIPLVCDALGIIYSEEDMGKAGGYDGALIREESRAGILVNCNIAYLGRKRFTGAHELGHYRIKHHNQKEYWCTARDIEDYRASNEAESEANRFAAELVLPSDRIVAEVKRNAPSMDLIRALSDQYGASLTATGLRVVKLAPDPCAWVVSASGRVKWKVPSSRLQANYEVREGPLSENTYAYDAFQGKSLPDKPRLVRADAWLTNVAPSLELIEHSISSPSLGMVLTLLTFVEGDDGDLEDIDE